MILTKSNNKELNCLSSNDTGFALLDLQDHGQIEVVDGKWVDRHGYRELMRRNAAHDRTVEMDVESAMRRANG